MLMNSSCSLGNPVLISSIAATDLAKPVHSNPKAAHTGSSGLLYDPRSRGTLVHVVFAQRVANPVFPHQNATQVRMTVKDNTHHVVYFTFMKIGCRPDVDRGRHPGILPGHVDFDDELAMDVGRFDADGDEMVDDLEPLVLVIDGSEVAQVIKGELGDFLEKGKELRDLVRTDVHFQPVVG